MVLRMVQVVVRNAVAVMPGAERPVPVFVLRADVGIQLGELVAGEFRHVVLRHPHGPVGMVDLHDVRPVGQSVQFELFLARQERQQRVPVLHPVASEHQLVELERTVALFIDIDLERGIERMRRNLVVIGKGDDVVSQLPVGVIHFLRPGLALVGREGPFHPRMRMQARPFPTEGRVQVPVRIVDIIAGKRRRSPEVINGAHPRNQDRQEQQDEDTDENLLHIIPSRTGNKMCRRRNNSHRTASSPSARPAFPALPASHT